MLRIQCSQGRWLTNAQVHNVALSPVGAVATHPITIWHHLTPLPGRALADAGGLMDGNTAHSRIYCSLRHLRIPVVLFSRKRIAASLGAITTSKPSTWRPYTSLYENRVRSSISEQLSRVEFCSPLLAFTTTTPWLNSRTQHPEAWSIDVPFC